MKTVHLGLACLLLAAAGPFQFSLPNVGMKPGNYPNSTLTIDAKGRIVGILPAPNGGVRMTGEAGETWIYPARNQGTNVIMIRWPNGASGVLAMQP